MINYLTMARPISKESPVAHVPFQMRKTFVLHASCSTWFIKAHHYNASYLISSMQRSMKMQTIDNSSLDSQAELSSNADIQIHIVRQYLYLLDEISGVFVKIKAALFVHLGNWAWELFAIINEVQFFFNLKSVDPAPCCHRWFYPTCLAW